MPPPTDFPAVRAAMAKHQPAHRAAQKLGFAMGFDRPQDFVEWDRVGKATAATSARVIDAYASELLPAILGGEWQRSHRTLIVKTPPLPRGYARATIVAGDWCRTLFDHPLHFHRRGSNGKLSWANCALIGQPYSSVMGKGGILADKGAIQDATSLAAHGVGVWVRRDLSVWSPGGTILVIAAQGLHPEDAASFGFVALGSFAAARAAA
jgi:hypothetical protein